MKYINCAIALLLLFRTVTQGAEAKMSKDAHELS